MLDQQRTTVNVEAIRRLTEIFALINNYFPSGGLAGVKVAGVNAEHLVELGPELDEWFNSTKDLLQLPDESEADFWARIAGLSIDLKQNGGPLGL